MIFVVAEIGINWNGDFELVKEMMYKSKKNGFNAVKFQSFNEEIIKKHPKKEILLESSISEKNVKEINKIATNIGIEWFATPMYLDAIDFLEPFVKKYKIREFDGRKLLESSSTELIEKVFQTKKDVFVSCESSPIKSIYYNYPNIKWLYCVPKYPCSLDDLNFKNIKEFYGYSNHCDEIIAPIIAAVLGSKLIEIHITSDKQKEFIDNPVSFDYGESFEIVKQIRNIERIGKL
jgi:sialic acid synthase SpsE